MLTFPRLLRWLQTTRVLRQRSQGLAEYGLIAASLAFVGAVGFNALGDAQKSYLISYPKVSAVPIAPNSLRHGTSVDDPSCAPSPAFVGKPLRCTAPIVRDAYPQQNDRNPPQGWVGLHVDDGLDPIVVCQLSSAGPDFSSCTADLVWIPDPALQNSTHRLSLWYECHPGASQVCLDTWRPTSNHLPNGSREITVTFLPNLAFSAAPKCVRDDNPSGNQVEVGHPIRCTIKVINQSLGGQPEPGVDVTWTTLPPLATGEPLLSCSTGGNPLNFPMIWGGAQCKPAPVMHCVTNNNNGQCDVIYRLVRTRLDPIPLTTGSQDLQVSVLGGAVTGATGTPQWPPRAITIVNALPPGHPVWTWLTCQALSPNVDVDAPRILQVKDFGLFQYTPKIKIHGTSGSVRCMPTVIDTDPNTALDCPAGPPWLSCKVGDPDRHDAHSPVGQVNWKLDTTVPVNPPTIDPTAPCTLIRRDTLGNQWGNQTPFASECANKTSVTLKGDVWATAKLKVEYSGSGSTHVNGANVPVDVFFVP